MGYWLDLDIFVIQISAPHLLAVMDLDLLWKWSIVLDIIPSCECSNQCATFESICYLKMACFYDDKMKECSVDVKSALRQYYPWTYFSPGSSDEETSHIHLAFMC